MFSNGTFVVVENFKPVFSIREHALRHLKTELNQDIEQLVLRKIRLDDSDDVVIRAGKSDIYVYLKGVTGGLAADDMNSANAVRAALLSDLNEPEIVHADEKMVGEYIHFYRVKERYGEFSNFARYPVQLDGKIWPTSEHYFQAQKFTGM